MRLNKFYSFIHSLIIGRNETSGQQIVFKIQLLTFYNHINLDFKHFCGVLLWWTFCCLSLSPYFTSKQDWVPAPKRERQNLKNESADIKLCKTKNHSAKTIRAPEWFFFWLAAWRCSFRGTLVILQFATVSMNILTWHFSPLKEHHMLLHCTTI